MGVWKVKIIKLLTEFKSRTYRCNYLRFLIIETGGRMIFPGIWEIEVNKGGFNIMFNINKS